MKEITIEQFELIPENEHKVRFANIGELVYTLEDIFIGTDTFSDETLEEMVSFFEDQEPEDTWFIPLTTRPAYVQFKPSEVRTEPKIMAIARKCLEMLIASTVKSKSYVSPKYSTPKRLAIQLLEKDEGYILVFTPDDSVRKLLKDCYKLMHSAATRNLPEYSWIEVMPDYDDGLEIYRWTTPFTHKVEKDDTILEDDDIVKNSLELMAIGQGPAVKDMRGCSVKNLYHDDAVIMPQFSFICDKEGFYIKGYNVTLTHQVEYTDVFTSEDWTELKAVKEDIISIDPKELVDTLRGFRAIKTCRCEVKVDNPNRIEKIIEQFEIDAALAKDILPKFSEKSILHLFGPKGENELTMEEAHHLIKELEYTFNTNGILYGYSHWEKDNIGAHIIFETEQ